MIFYVRHPFTDYNQIGSLELLTFALDRWRRFEHVPQRFVTRVTVGRHVIVHGNKLMPHVVDCIHSVLKQTEK